MRSHFDWRSLAPSVLCALSLLAGAPQAFAQRGVAPAASAPANETMPVPPEFSSVAGHELTLDGKTLRYAATAGNLVIDDEEERPYGSIFYVAYTLAAFYTRAAPGTR